MKKLLVFGVIVLFLSVSVIPSTGTTDVKQITVPTSKGDTLYVGGSGPNNYTKIQDAINDSSNGDTVFVYIGTYYESIEIDKSITLIGEDRNNTIIDANMSGDVVYVSADWVNISGFTIRGGYDGIDIDSDYNTITDNTISLNNGSGIRLSWSSNSNKITGNTISSNSFQGIKLYISSNNTITGNNISNNGFWLNGFGIWLESTSNNTITGNNIISNYRIGIYIRLSNNNTITGNSFFNDGLWVWDSYQNTVSKNTVNGKPLVCLEDESDLIINDAGQVILQYCNNITVLNQELSNTTVGIELWATNNCLISSNTISSNNMDGLYLLCSSNNIILGNTISSNNGSGIYFCCSSRNNNITGNNITSNNGHGIDLHYSSNDNIIYHNNFINNSQNAHDSCDNTWDDGEYGNYWDDYNGTDTDGDGIGDVPYNISGKDNRDRYPLMEPYGMTELTISWITSGLFKSKSIIKNIGNNTAFNVNWNITIEGGFVLLGKESSGTVPKPLIVGEEVTITTGIILGFGPITITVVAWADNAPLVSKSTPGFLFLFYIKINPGGWK